MSEETITAINVAVAVNSEVVARPKEPPVQYVPNRQHEQLISRLQALNQQQNNTRECCGFTVCWMFITGMIAIVGLGTFLTGCNSIFYPLGCPLYTSTVGTVVNTTSSRNCDIDSCRHTVLIDWSVCTEQVDGGKNSDMEWADFTMNSYPTGHQEKVWLPKPNMGVIGGCFSENFNRSVSRDLPIVGIIFLTLTGALVFCVCILMYFVRKCEQKDQQDAFAIHNTPV